MPGITVTRELVELLSASPRFVNANRTLRSLYAVIRRLTKVQLYAELNENKPQPFGIGWRSNAEQLIYTSSVLTNCLLLKTTKQR